MIVGGRNYVNDTLLCPRAFFFPTLSTIRSPPFYYECVEKVTAPVTSAPLPHGAC